MIRARIVADSRNVATTDRLTSFVITFPRFVLAELNTHRVLSKNTASSRAIPVARQLQRVLDAPVLPLEWGQNRPGMQSTELVPRHLTDDATTLWTSLSREAARVAEALRTLGEAGVHKQYVNRVIEPWTWSTCLVSGTQWENFFALRCHRDAQPEMQWLADEMLFAYVDHQPAALLPGAWHLPFGDQLPVGLSLADQLRVVVARCARLSTESFDGDHSVEKDFRLHDDLLAAGHMSPFEHPAVALDTAEWSGNFRGFGQYRKQLPNEQRSVDLFALAAERRAHRTAWIARGGVTPLYLVA